MRVARLALIEKGVEHALVDVDFSKGTMPAEHLPRHPFGKVPVLRHGDFMLYETAAICRYIDAGFSGPALQPVEPKALGRMAQVIALIDTYLAEDIRMGFVSERLINPMVGLPTDERRAKNAEASIAKGFAALSACLSDGAYMVSDDITLADLHAAPFVDYLCRTPGGSDMLEAHPRLAAWWVQLKQRPSIKRTEPELSIFGGSYES